MAVTINKSLSQTARDLGVSLASLMAANPQIKNVHAILSGTQLNEQPILSPEYCLRVLCLYRFLNPGQGYLFYVLLVLC